MPPERLVEKLTGLVNKLPEADRISAGFPMVRTGRIPALAPDEERPEARRCPSCRRGSRSTSPPFSSRSQPPWATTPTSKGPQSGQGLRDRITLDGARHRSSWTAGCCPTRAFTRGVPVRRRRSTSNQSHPQEDRRQALNGASEWHRLLDAMTSSTTYIGGGSPRVTGGPRPVLERITVAANPGILAASSSGRVPRRRLTVPRRM
jgi:hypothetical protein